MKCPHCGRDIADNQVMSHAARIAGKRSRRTLDADTAREMQRRAAESRRQKRSDTGEPNTKISCE